MERLKIYWKNGFYDYEVDGGMEITDEYRRELLEEQSNGKRIITGDDGLPVAVDYVVSEEDLRNRQVLKLKAFLDSTDWVNSKAADLGSTSKELYPDVWQERLDARTEINRLEKIIEQQ